MSISDCFSQVMVDHWANLVLYQDYRRGTVTGLDSYARVPTASSGVLWQQGRYGKALRFTGLNTLTIADAGATPELRLTTGTICCFGDFTPEDGLATQNGRMVSKRTVGGAVNYEFYFSGSGLNRISIYDGTVESWLDVVPVKYVGLSVAWVAGAVPRFFANGVFKGVGSAITNTAAQTVPLYIGNNPGAAGLVLRSPLSTVCIFNTQLTDAEISRLHDDWLLSRGALR